MIYECFLALYYESFIYEVMFYEAWPQNKVHNLNTDMWYFYNTDRQHSTMPW